MILVVEDNALVLKYLSDMLIQYGYQIRPANDGELALRSILAKKPDLILLDMDLPGMDGLELCRLLKAEAGTKDIPIIFIIAMDETELKVKALDAGGVDYITKPFEDSEIRARISTHLNMYKMLLKCH